MKKKKTSYGKELFRYVLERGDSCFTEYIGRNGGYQDIIIGSECAEVKKANFVIKKFLAFYVSNRKKGDKAVEWHSYFAKYSVTSLASVR